MELLRLVEDRVDRELIPMQEIATHICISFDRLVFSTESQQVLAWDGAAIQQVSLDPPVTASVIALDCHSKIAMILFEGGHLYKLEGSSLVAIQDPFFKKKPIGLIASGLLHSLALQREEWPPLASWFLSSSFSSRPLATERKTSKFVLRTLQGLTKERE